jgi:hypothetical protein
MTLGQDWARRDFLRTGSVVVPILKRMLAVNAASTEGRDELGVPPDPGEVRIPLVRVTLSFISSKIR